MSFDCTQTRARLSAYFDAELEEPQAAAVDLHLASCAECRAELAALRELSEDLRATFGQVLQEAPERTAPSAPLELVGFSTSTRPRHSDSRACSSGAPWGRLAVAALALLAASLAWRSFAARGSSGEREARVSALSAAEQRLATAAERTLASSRLAVSSCSGSLCLEFEREDSTGRVAWEARSSLSTLRGGFDGDAAWVEIPDEGLVQVEVTREPDREGVTRSWLPPGTWLPPSPGGTGGHWPELMGPEVVDVLCAMAAGRLRVPSGESRSQSEFALVVLAPDGSSALAQGRLTLTQAPDPRVASMELRTATSGRVQILLDASGERSIGGSAGESFVARCRAPEDPPAWLGVEAVPDLRQLFLEEASMLRQLEGLGYLGYK